MSLKLGSSFARLNAGSSSVKRMFLGSSGAWNADAADWVARVEANGGSVSTVTANAVTAFCNAIDAAEIRDKFYRLNLFCGTGLNACLVPLYRGPEFKGTQHGSVTDINNGPFVPGDYVETGATGGLSGNGLGKYLDTGLAMNFTNTQDYHVSFAGADFSGNVGMAGADTFGDGTSPRFLQSVISLAGATRTNIWYNLGTSFRQTFNNQNYSGLTSFLGTGNASGNNLYIAGVSVATSGATGAGVNANTYPIYVFAVNVKNASQDFIAAARSTGYSIGLHLSSTQVAAYESAAAAFRLALGR